MCRTVLLRSSLPSRDTNYGALLSDMDVSAVGGIAGLKASTLEEGATVGPAKRGLAQWQGGSLCQGTFASERPYGVICERPFAVICKACVYRAGKASWDKWAVRRFQVFEHHSLC